MGLGKPGHAQTGRGAGETVRLPQQSPRGAQGPWLGRSPSQRALAVPRRCCPECGPWSSSSSVIASENAETMAKAPQPWTKAAQSLAPGLWLYGLEQTTGAHKRNLRGCLSVKDFSNTTHQKIENENFLLLKTHCYREQASQRLGENVCKIYIQWS